MSHTMRLELRLRSACWLGALGVVLVLTTLVLSQCRPVADSVTGMDLYAGGRTSLQHKQCTMKCDSLHTLAKRVELDRHRAAIMACGGNMECRRNEHDLYREGKRRIEAEKKACKRACYDEGRGSGGR